MQNTESEFLEKYNIDDIPLFLSDVISGKPIIYSAEKEGDLFIIKHWPRSVDVRDEEVEAIWLHELRQLHRLNGFPGAEDLIATLVESGKDTQGFYLVLDAQDRLPLSYLMHQKLLTRKPFWIKNLKRPDQRAHFWKNILRISSAIDILHNQGLLHRQLGEESILSTSTQHDSGRDFQLTGFEWAMRVPALPNRSSEILNAAETPTYSFANDWRDLGVLIAKLLKLEVQSLQNISEPIRDISSSSGLMLIEIVFIKKLLGVIPFRSSSTYESIDGVFAKDSITEIIGALDLGVSKVAHPYSLAIKVSSNPEAKLHPNSVTSRIQDIYKAKYGVTLDKTNTEELKRFVENDIADSALLLKAVPPNKETTYLLKGNGLTYQLDQFSPGRFSEEKTWDIAVCDRAYTEPPPHLMKYAKIISIASEKISTITISDAFSMYRGLAGEAEENSWISLFNKFEGGDTTRTADQQKLIDGFIVCHLTEIAYARAEIFPVELISCDSDGENYNVQVCSKSVEDSERLAKSLDLEPPAVRLEKILKKDEGEFETLVWTLVSGTGFGKEDEEIILDYQKFHMTEEGRIVYNFTTKIPIPYQHNYFIAPNSLQGTIRQLSRRSKALDTLTSHTELINVLISPQKYSNAFTLPADIDRHISKLDESKQKSFKRIVSTHPISLVQGPPGVGKTFLVSTLVKYFFEQEFDSRILLTAQSHSTVQHLYHEVCQHLNENEGANELLIIRCSKQDKNDETSLIDADEKAKKHISNFLNSELFIKSSSDQIKNEARSLLAGQIYKRHPIINQLLRAANIVFSTTNSEQVERMIKDRAQFDWSIMEETGKATGLELVSPLLLSHRRLMIGDHKQLPPYRSNEITSVLSSSDKLKVLLQDSENIFSSKVKGDATKLFLDDLQNSEKSIADIGRIASKYLMLFKALVEDEVEEAKQYKHVFGSYDGRTAIGSMLTVQHRMHPDIAGLISNVFYDDELATDEEKKKLFTEPNKVLPYSFKSSLLLNNSAPITWIDMPDVQTTKKMKLGDDFPRWHNLNERKVITSLLGEIQANRHSQSPCKIAILSPYAEQVGRISRFIYKQGKLKPEFSHLSDFEPANDHSDFCSTVDSFQGSEADVVIISLVRNNGNPTLRGALGFLADERRMNVLLSRARHKLIMVGSYSFMKYWGASDAVKTADANLNSQAAFFIKLIAKLESLVESGKMTVIPSHELVDQDARNVKSQRRKGALSSHNSSSSHN
ncbi:AAA domain-containing protein [Pseudomonas bijieensis]|uniref:AAA domain-containing protein n=1 Tax=Pseudomonas bijieensis TaxID=2681983 RepID=UPI001E2C68C2|nr:AAA domain-containing protein [Pseudomonas bijieensis]MCD9116088.1 AAA domain-containing protein [Pseudomonas bijieensis]